MEGFGRIDLKDNASASVKNNNGLLKRKKILIPLLVIIVLGLFSLFFVVLPAQRTYASARKAYTQAKKAVDAIKKQNVVVASSELKKAKEDLKETQEDLLALSFLRFVPIASGYYNDADHLIKAGSYGLDAASVLVGAIEPYADLLGFKGQGSFVMGSAEQRIQTAVMTMGKITPKIDEVSSSFVLAQKEINAVNPNHYPGFIMDGKIKNQLLQIQDIAGKSVTAIDEARPLIKVLPSLLGETKEKKYLVLFQNDKELRATGGFITAYAIFRIDKGIIHVDASDDIYNLDNRMTKRAKAPEPILKYLPKVTTFNLRDSNLSPDFIESMKTFESMYDSIPGKTKVDGIIALDTHVLVSTIKILDDEVFAAGIKFNTKQDPRCNCPQVIYVLEDNISRPVNYQKSGRKDLLGALLYSIMEKSLKSSPKIYWGPLIQDLLNEANQKHVLFYLYDKEAQGGIEALNAAGKIRDFEGDYLHINDVNFAGAKSNMYVSQSVTQNIDIQSDGTITKTVTIDYKNPYPPSDCNLERGGLCLNAEFRDWLRIYVPKGSKLIDSQGSEVKITTSEDLGKTVFEGFLTVRPLGKASYTLKYSLPFKLAAGSSLPLLIQKQPGTDKNKYEIKLKGRIIEKFDLLTDKETKIKP